MKYLYARYNEIHAKILNRPVWTQEDIEEMQGEMLQRIKAEQAQLAHVTDRLSYLLKRIEATVQAQDDLEEVGTETEDCEVNLEDLGYREKYLPD